MSEAKLGARYRRGLGQGRGIARVDALFEAGGRQGGRQEVRHGEARVKELKEAGRTSPFRRN